MGPLKLRFYGAAAENLRRAVALAVLACAGAACAGWAGQAGAAGIELADDRGRVLRLAHPAGRIVTLAPHLTELVYAAGAGAKLVGAARYSDYPEAARRLPAVGDAAQVDVEQVLALAPDVVLGWRSGNPPAQIERLERLGVAVFVTEPARLTDVARILRAIGTLAGSAEAAGKAAAAFEGELGRLARGRDRLRPVPVFYEVWHQPLLTVSDAHSIGDVIRLCGGRNVFGASAALTPEVSLESVIAAAPEVILGGGSAARAKDFAAAWQRFDVIPAVRNRRVHFIDADLIQRPTPRLLRGAELICGYIDAARTGAGN